jgi:hypothetical protein
MAELTLNHDQRHTLARHLDGMGVPELVRRKPAPDTGGDGDAAQVRARCGA